MKDIVMSSEIGFGIGAIFTLCRLPIFDPYILPGVLSIMFMCFCYLAMKYLCQSFHDKLIVLFLYEA